jgi:leader peptidase (prepilin peptidase)/N-methyltransferase
VHGALRQTLLSIILLLTVAASLVSAPPPDGLFGAFLGVLMIAIAVCDAERFIIPNELTGAAIALALLRAISPGPDHDWFDMVWPLARAVAVTAPFLLLMIGYRYWRGRDGLGFGDIKLAAVAGAWLDWTTIFVAIELAALVALGAYVLNGIIRKRRLRGTAFLPFGLFLAPAIWIGWLIEVWFG